MFLPPRTHCCGLSRGLHCSSKWREVNYLSRRLDRRWISYLRVLSELDEWRIRLSIMMKYGNLNLPSFVS